MDTHTGVGPAPLISADDEVYARNRLPIFEEPLEGLGAMPLLVSCKLPFRG
jgi:hypothetical protein